MKKNIKIALSILVIIILSFLFYRNWIIKKIQPPILGVEKFNDFNSFEAKVLNPVDDYVKFDVKYPYFNGADKDFNLSIENFVKSQMEDHRIISEDNWNARFDTRVEGDAIAKIPANEDEKFSFFSDFTMVQSNSNYISFILRYGGFSGGAHGYENIISFNYDVINKRNIELKDLFANNPQYLNVLSIKSREYLKEQFATVSEEDKENSSPDAIREYVDNIVSMIESGTEPKEENFSTFTFTEDKIKIYFAQYQVGPYVIGMPEFEMFLR